MDASVTVSIISGVGVILSAWFAFAGNKKGTLATAEQNFRSTILADNESLRKRVSELEKKFEDVLTENGQLKIENAKLKAGSSQSESPQLVSVEGGAS